MTRDSLEIIPHLLVREARENQLGRGSKTCHTSGMSRLLIMKVERTPVTTRYMRVDVLRCEKENGFAVLCKQYICAQATIQDVRENGAQLHVAYENEYEFSERTSWQEATWADSKHVRHPGPPGGAEFKPKANDLVELLTKAFPQVAAMQAPEEPNGWWKARILAKSESNDGMLFMVHFEGWENYDDIVTAEFIRPRSTIQTFESPPLAKVDIRIPRDVDSSGLDDALFKDMPKPASVFSMFVTVDEAKHPCIRCIGSKSAIRNSKLLAKMLFKHRKELMELNKEKKAAEEKLEVLLAKLLTLIQLDYLLACHIRYFSLDNLTLKYKILSQKERERLGSCKVLKLPILNGMAGMVIGKGGKNIKRAKKIEGVRSIRVLDDDKQLMIVAE
eukprot:1347376-Amorphochlora_amoeboformis.AAC.3